MTQGREAFLEGKSKLNLKNMHIHTYSIDYINILDESDSGLTYESLLLRIILCIHFRQSQVSCQSWGVHIFSFVSGFDRPHKKKSKRRQILCYI